MPLWKLALYSLIAWSSLAGAQGAPVRSAGQTLYLPVYSHIWHGDVDSKGQAVKTLMSVLVSIRNTDVSKPMQITSAQYYDGDGKKLRNYVPAAQTIPPMGTYEFFIPRSDDSGGSGANFVVVWRAAAPVNLPIVEAVHANLPAGRAIAFVTSARPIAPE